MRARGDYVMVPFVGTIGDAPAEDSPRVRTLRWLALAVSNGRYAEVVSLELATSRLYPNGPRPAWSDGIHWPRWQDMRRVYERTKGQPFVLEPDDELRALAEVSDVGPLFLWWDLWVFAGSPKLDQYSDATERPTWRPGPDGHGVALRRAMRGGRVWPPQPWVKRLREYQRTGR